MRIKICKKESKETRLWFRHLLTYENHELENKRVILIKEAEELMLIFAAILRKPGD